MIMEFRVAKDVLDAGVKILFDVIEGIDNATPSEEWNSFRNEKIKELLVRYQDLDVHQDPILEGYNILHDNTGVRRRKNIPASENLIKLLRKHGGMSPINKAVDIYNFVSMDTKLALGAHNIDKVDGNVTLRFTDGTEHFRPIGADGPIPIAAHEYSYIDDSNEVLCRLEIRQVLKTLVTEETKNIFYIVQGNAATSEEYLREGAQQIIDLTTKFCGGRGRIVVPTVI
jgi:DNA/RNA-binding domain of Phe-tRNA-synthetase-like protein